MPRSQRELQMLDAAEAEFGRNGLLAGSMDEIAYECGVTKTMLFRYFGTKEGLYQACVERVRARLFGGIEERLAGIPAGRERLHVFIDAYFGSLDEQRGKRWLLYGEMAGGTANLMRQANTEVVMRLLRSGLPTALPEPDLEVLAHSMVGAGEQVGRWWLDHPEIPREEIVERFEVVAAAMTVAALAPHRTEG